MDELCLLLVEFSQVDAGLRLGHAPSTAAWPSVLSPYFLSAWLAESLDHVSIVKKHCYTILSDYLLVLFR